MLNNTQTQPPVLLAQAANRPADAKTDFPTKHDWQLFHDVAATERPRYLPRRPIRASTNIKA
ncbi:hypothetical protein RirG_099330 [Rhizophagus irregularis DAOM 197198w]|uniref:Uncharacterized protein n=1 Tax=Rhizophagus irregularis (strain DAOM 197198w) TaxID=1432141 RepID=A0A015KNC9_RHIIW|nr:hypothetical protein RirG_099330 [Rhizophagus irregularis DAOM 197198w]